MLSTKEITRVYETMLKSSWMKEEVKVSFKVSRRDILFITQIVEKGISAEDAKSLIPDEAVQAIKGFLDDILKRAELTELREIPVS